MIVTSNVTDSDVAELFVKGVDAKNLITDPITSGLAFSAPPTVSINERANANGAYEVTLLPLAEPTPSPLSIPVEITNTANDETATGSVVFIAGPPVAIALEIVDELPVATTVSINPNNDHIPVGATVQLVATVLDQYGKPLSPQPPVTWSLDDPATGEVSGEGLYSSPAVGAPSGVDHPRVTVTGTEISTFTAVNFDA